MAVLQMMPSNFEIIVGDPIIFALPNYFWWNEWNLPAVQCVQYTIYTMCTEQWTWLKSSLDIKSSKTFFIVSNPK